MNGCPPTDHLRLFLAGELSDAEGGTIEAHVEGCSACQNRLAELTADPLAAQLRRGSSSLLASTFLERVRESDVHSQAPPPPAIPGYEILGELGRGGMGVVFRARHLRLNRVVAVKMLLDSRYAGAELRLRFVIEGEAVARLSHPGIVQVYEWGEADGRPFLAMEFVGGGTLAERLTVGPAPPPREAAELVARLADAIAAAHAQGVIHRDLKPANVLLGEHTAGGSPSLTPKVSDFGLARLDDTTVTQTGAVMGTPAYMAPEQAGGRGHEIGTATDVYALGVILYELLAGHTPFASATALDTLYQVLHRDVPPLKDVPRDLDTICRKCLEKDPARRYRSADALAADLRAYLDHRVISARPAGAFERMCKWAKRNPGRAAVVAAGLILSVGGVIAFAQVRHTVQVRERAARAESLVQGLATADTSEVPRLLDELAPFRDLTVPQLRRLAEGPVTTKPGLHARAALLADEPHRAAELAAHIPVCSPDELPVLARLLTPHAATVAPRLWQRMPAVRAAGTLAALSPDDSRWKEVAPAVVDAVVAENPLEAVVWARALEPVRGVLSGPLLKRYTTARDRIRGGRLDGSALVAEVVAFDLAANLLARYVADRPADLADLAVTVDARHHPLIRDALRARRDDLLPAVRAELAAAAPADPDAARRANAAAVLLTLGEADGVWPLFAFPADRAPGTRSYLIQRCAAIGVDPKLLVRRFDEEPDVSARRALLCALGDYPLDAEFAARLLALYRTDPDAGVHAMLDWVLRRKWGKEREVAVIDAELTAARSARAGWFVNGEGQTYSVIRGPVEFTLGSPPTEPGRLPKTEVPHPKRIPRSFAVAAKEVTVEQFLRFRPGHEFLRRNAPDPTCPVLSVTWYEAVAYCNWLNKVEGVPPDQWCYEPNEKGEYADGMRIRANHLSLTGYRLPTEAEWEYACRGGSVTARFFGRGEELLPRYTWFLKNAEYRSWPVGALRPNDFGLFDIQGNANEWVEDEVPEAREKQPFDDAGADQRTLVDEKKPRLIRGASFNGQAMAVRVALHNDNRPGARNDSNGFRPVRTVR